MGGRGSSSGAAARGGGGGVKNSSQNIKTIEGVKGTVFTSLADVLGSSPNTIWLDTGKRSHAVFSDGKRELAVKGDKNKDFSLLDNVNTGVVYLREANSGNTREVNRLNSSLKTIRDMGFDTPKIFSGRYETIVYVKRLRFTREW